MLDDLFHFIAPPRYNIYSTLLKNVTNTCRKIKNSFSGAPSIISIVNNEDSSKIPLCDYYIKSAYNCCCTGKYSNDFVNICSLENCIEQGVRFLDFEIYSINNKPVVSASTNNNFKSKEMYNSIDIIDVFNLIREKAFSSGSCPNYNDPLILHFRISSNNINIYNKLSNHIGNILNNYILSSTYSNEYNGQNISELPISNFKRKIIIIVDKSNPIYKQTKLKEFVNISSNSELMHILRYSNVKYDNTNTELMNFNKQHISIVLPDMKSSNKNHNYLVTQNYGCQILAMSFQNNDSNLETYNRFFNDAGRAFVLKPNNMRYTPITIDKPNPYPAKYSFTPRRISGNNWEFNI